MITAVKQFASPDEYRIAGDFNQELAIEQGIESPKQDAIQLADAFPNSFLFVETIPTIPGEDPRTVMISKRGCKNNNSEVPTYLVGTREGVAALTIPEFKGRAVDFILNNETAFQIISNVDKHLRMQSERGEEALKDPIGTHTTPFHVNILSQAFVVSLTDIDTKRPEDVDLVRNICQNSDSTKRDYHAFDIRMIK